MALLVKSVGDVKTRAASKDGIGFMYVTNYYKLFGIIPLYERVEILNLSA